ncbi:zinc finger protein 142-like isoform X2 [Anoplophora glabripennis]|nr:zinc finger protein 142-like isoform X2 [Anoplophora glabripennis]
MCNACSLKVTEAFNFKTVCLYTNDTIIAYAHDDESGCSIDLREIYAKETENTQSINTLKHHKVCRLCMQLITDKFISVHEMEVDMIEKFIPEINFNIVKDQVICRPCFDSFSAHSSFIKKCLELEEKIKSIHNADACDSLIRMPSLVPYIKSEEIDIKSEVSEQEEELLETYSTTPKLEHKETLQDNEYGNGPSNLSFHNLEHKEISETKKNKHVPKGHLRKSEKEGSYSTNLHEVRTYMCDLCDFTTKYKDGLRIHQLRHADPSKIDMYECNLCEYKTRYKNILKRHHLTHVDPSEVQFYKCGLCDFKSKYKHSLSLHQLKHADASEMPMYTCDMCDFNSKYKNNLKFHQLIHTAEIYKCDSCDYITKHKHRFRLHKLRHTDAPNVRIYRCDLCDFLTKTKYRLERHHLKHTDFSKVQTYTCDFCNFQTKYKYSLKTHQLKHADPSKVRMYKCDSCDYKSKYKGHIKSHQWKHTV